MGKIKNQLLAQQEEEFEFELSYREYLEANYSEPSAIEIIEMAREMLSPSTFQKMLWCVVSANNIGYRPTSGRGA
jgi:hypothetical protein